MNKKEQELNRIVDIVISCCNMNDHNNNKVMTREDVIGTNRSRCENCVMTRCILSYAIISSGFTAYTVSKLLGITMRSVSDLMSKDSMYYKTSHAYRLAREESINLIGEKKNSFSMML